MKKSRFTDSQVIAILKEAESGVRVPDLCREHGISETCYRYQAKLSGDNQVIADWLLRLTTTNRTWGFGLCYLYLRNVKGYGYNHKRVYRIYRELELNLRIKPKRRLKRDKPDVLAVPRQVNVMWSMDFMPDALADGSSFRTFNVLDDYNRKDLVLRSTNPCLRYVSSGPLSGSLSGEVNLRLLDVTMARNTSLAS